MKLKFFVRHKPAFVTVFFPIEIIVMYKYLIVARITQNRKREYLIFIRESLKIIRNGNERLYGTYCDTFY
jgi:hypothetical protein